MSRVDDLLNAIQDRFYEWEQRDIHVNRMYLHEAEIRYLRESDQFTPAVAEGSTHCGTLWGTIVYCDDRVPAGSVYLEPEICAEICVPLGKLGPGKQDFEVELEPDQN